METEQKPTPLWQQDESLRAAGARLAKQPCGIRVVSFDFFDTLLCRLCAEPADLFIEVGRQLARQGLLQQPVSPPEFRAVRLAADERARKNAVKEGRFPEVQLAHIYRELKQVVTDPAAAQKIEFEVERSFCYLNPAVAELVRHARELGCKTALVSDTYFTAAQLVQLLRDNGMSGSEFDHIFVSSECGKAKWNSQLYHDVFRHFDVHPSEVLHLGDNKKADVERPRQMGVAAVQYYRTTANLDAIFASERSLLGTQLHPAASLNSLRVTTARRAASDEDPFRDGAMVFGPVLSRYADWCVERLRASGVRKVLALMREGELLGELVQRAAAAAGVEFSLVPCFVSRMSTARAALPAATAENVLELLEGSTSLTAEAVLEIVGLGAEGAQFIDEETRRKPLTSPESIAGLVRLLFKLPGLSQQIEARRLESHKLAFAYLTSLVGEEKAVGILDLGWSGSIQRNIARILRLGGRQVRTVGCYLACTRRAGRLAIEGDAASAYMEPDWSRSTILAEVAITACVGSTDGYRLTQSGQVVPVLGPFEITPAERQAKQRLRDGILAFQAHWLALRGDKQRPPLSSEALADFDCQSAAAFYRLLEFPTKPEADRLGVLTHDENYFGQNHSAPLCADAAALRLRREGAQALFQAARYYWPQGVAARSHPRLVSTLRSGWNDPLALGRWGAWHGPASADAGATDEELFALGAWLRNLAPAQVVFCGPATPALAEALSWLDQPAASEKPLLIVASPDTVAPAQHGSLSHAAVMTVNLETPEAIRSLRTRLLPGGDIALVLTSDLTESATRLLLNGLAPFLGPQGMVLAAAGRFDRFTREDEARLPRQLNTWLNATGKELGFDLCIETPEDVVHACNWVCLRRNPEALVWNRQWMPTLADLAYTE